MVEVMEYPLTKQGVRDLDHPLPASPINVGPQERTVSTLAGAVLAGWGIAQGTTMGLLLAAAGASLAYRGVTGHCSAYAAAGINTAQGR